MGYAVILLPSTSHAMHAEAALKRAGIGCKMIPVPRHISSDCGVCIRIAREDREAARAALAAAGIAWEGMHDC
jgi:bacterioferritin-associated ferredoxin